jgi:hypothetical protein
MSNSSLLSSSTSSFNSLNTSFASVHNKSSSPTSSNSTLTIKKPYVPKSKQRILPSNFGTKKRLNTTSSLSNTITKSQIIEEKLDQNGFKNSLTTLPPPPPLMPFDLFTIDNKSSKNNAPPPPPPPFPIDLFQNEAVNLVPPPPPLPLFINSDDSKDQKSNENKVPHILPNQKPAIPILTLKDELLIKQPLKQIEKNQQQQQPPKQKEFDINEIKTFKFKKRSNSKISVNDTAPKPKNTNSWSCLMDEIKTGTKLRNVNNSKTQDDGDLNTNRKKLNSSNYGKSSKLEFDLNLILSQRSKFFNRNDDEDDDEDDDGSFSDSSWNAALNNNIF